LVGALKSNAANSKVKTFSLYLSGSDFVKSFRYFLAKASFFISVSPLTIRLVNTQALGAVNFGQNQFLTKSNKSLFLKKQKSAIAQVYSPQNLVFLPEIYFLPNNILHKSRKIYYLCPPSKQRLSGWVDDPK